MASLSLCSHSKVSFGFRGKQTRESFNTGTIKHGSPCCYAPGVLALIYTNTSIASKPFHLCWLSIKVSASSGRSRSSSSRRVYKQSQAHASVAMMKEMASSVLLAGAFAVVIFVLWKMVEKILIPKPVKPVSEENKPTQGVKWSFSPGTNLLSSFGAKRVRESKLRLNDFAKEIRLFASVDMSGCDFGDEGLFFLAESLAYNQVAKEVNFAANGINAEGIKVFDGILQSNIALKSLNLSGNSIGDEGVKCLCDILVKDSFQKLQLSSGVFGDEDAKAIAEMLKKNSSSQVCT